MNIDPVILATDEQTVAAIIEDAAIRPHLRCECVDTSDPDILAAHLADEVLELLKPMDPEFSRWVLAQRTQEGT